MVLQGPRFQLPVRPSPSLPFDDDGRKDAGTNRSLLSEFSAVLHIIAGFVSIKITLAGWGHHFEHRAKAFAKASE